MPDVIRELERYGRMVDSSVTPITIDELQPPTSRDSVPVRRPRWVPVWATAVATAAMVLMGVGGISLLLSGAEDANEPGSPGAPTTVMGPTSPDLAMGLSADSFTWTRHDLDGAVAYPTPWQDGYVGLVDDRVAGSSDGVVWQSWPNQPPIDARSGLRGLVVDGDRVVVISDLDATGTHPPTLPALAAWASTGDGWRRVDVDDPIAPDIQPLAPFLSTDGDHIIVATGSGTWTLDGDRLRIMDVGTGRVATTASLHQVVERAWPDDAITLPGGLETVTFGERAGRFVAFGSPPFGPAHTWTSSDGRVWRDIPPVLVPWDADTCHAWVASLLAEQDGDGTVVPEEALSEGCDAPWVSETVTPSVVATGPLGWIAVGSAEPTGAPAFIWYSPDGLAWEAIDSIDGLANSQPDWVSFPPIVLVEGERILVYASSTAASGAPEPLAWASGAERQPSLWIGEPDR